ncbi:AlpA family phage regulatory protein [Vibrio sp. YMD68]|uniref:helix-turn-helix transcriptional regulator n=1 Tax=Vibrio sp. YMD68 TaxID=3042300 RepID=UPI00249A9CE0|nr:AlpA family phage regulatory protein [Vibrio sp. YMD68]WGW01759.1 AlpA family phage regulatory protein [Vibrio sp. YMD68]
MNELRILRLNEVINRVGVSRSTIYVWMQEGNFPKNIVLGRKSVGWLNSDISNWIKQRSGRVDS